MEWLKQKLRNWLGIERNLELIRSNEQAISNLVKIGVDVNFRSPHTIIIFSRLNGGQLREIPVHFDNLKDLEYCVEDLKARYRTKDVLWDVPALLKRYF